jgi:hypothetical protein
VKIGDIACTNLMDLSAERIQATCHSSGTLVVSAETPAIAAIQTALKDEARLILVTDQIGDVTGLVAPAWLQGQLGIHRGSYDILQGLSEMQSDPAEIARRFHHEWLTHERPTLHWCSQGNHLTDEDPCSSHGG